MSTPGPEGLYPHEPALLNDCQPHPVLDLYLRGRGWVAAGVGIWWWTDSVAETGHEKWDITTVCWNGRQVLVGLVGDWRTHMFLRESPEDLARQITALEAMRWEG